MPTAFTFQSFYYYLLFFRTYKHKYVNRKKSRASIKQSHCANNSESVYISFFSSDVNILIGSQFPKEFYRPIFSFPLFFCSLSSHCLEAVLPMLLPKSFHFIALFFFAAFIHPKTFNFEAKETLVKGIYSKEKCASKERKFFSFFTTPYNRGESCKKITYARPGWRLI